MIRTPDIGKKLLAACTLTLLLLPGCAGAGSGSSANPTATSSGTVNNAPATNQENIPANSQTESNAAQAAGQSGGHVSGEEAADRDGQGLQAARSTASPKKSAPGEKAAPSSSGATASPGSALSSSAKMLVSSGRAPSAQQPEAGFTLRVPDSIGDGEAFQLEFGAEGAKEVQVSWRGKKLALGPCPGEDTGGVCRALLPVPLDEKARTLPLSLTVSWADGKTERFQADLPVKKRKYPIQRLKVDQKYVSPPAEMQAKIKQDRAELNAAISRISPLRYWQLPFLRPVPGEVTSLYGMRRVFNGQPKSPHKGVDFNAKTGDPVAALDDGIVTLVSNHYYSGNIVIIDHGLGVFSSYIHLSGFNVIKGQKVSRGDTIGFIGSTGRVTGPHLHLSLFVLGVGVNAAACIDM